MSAININKNNFQNEIMDSEKTVLLDFWAPWCAPCRMVVPIIEEITGERPDIKVGKINVDEQPELASKFGIILNSFCIVGLTNASNANLSARSSL